MNESTESGLTSKNQFLKVHKAICYKFSEKKS